MPRGSHRAETERARWPVVLGIAVTVVVAATAAWFLLVRDGGVVGDGDHPVADFSFEMGKVGGSAVGDRASKEDIEESAEEIRGTLDDMYLAGFLDPEKWEGGTFPEVLEAFSSEAQRQARRDLSVLTLGSDATKIEFMDPVDGRLNIRFLVDGEQQLTAAVATTNFTAEGRLKSGGPAFAGHFATYYLQPDGSSWVIVGYDAHVQVDEGRLPEAQGPTDEPEETP